jgi:cell division protein FtsL
MPQITNSDIKELTTTISSLTTSMSGLQEEMRLGFANVNLKLTEVRGDIKALDTRIVEVEKKIDKLDQEFKTTSTKQDNRLWTLGFLLLAPVLTGFVAVVVRLFFMSPNL